MQDIEGKKMIRVLHTIDTTGPGGAETVFVNLATKLDPLKFVSVAAIFGPGWVCDTLRKHGIEPLFVHSRGGFNVRYLQELMRIVRVHKIDLIQSHLLGSSLYSSVAGLMCGVPVVASIHGFVDASANERLMWLKSQLVSVGSNKIVFVSDRLRKHGVSQLGFTSKKSTTIYNGVDTSVFQPKEDDSIRKELGIGPEHVVIGAVGNIRPAKGYALFLKAARLIHDQHPECRFVIAGQGSGPLYEELLKLRDALGLQEVFFFIGFRGDPAQVYNNLDIFVLPSTSEGFSLSTIEAAACGLPVVVTRSGGPEEIVTNGGIQGAVVDCNEVALYDALTMYVNDKYFKKHVGKNIESIHSVYSIENMLKSYALLYQNCVDDKKNKINLYMKTVLL